MPAAPAAAPPASTNLAWLDRLKGFGLLWIFANHAAEQAFGGPHFGNPHAAWPPLADRVSQLAPVTGQGVWDVPLNVLRAFGWLGDQGVSLFILLSGFGLTWGLLRRGAGARLPVGGFLVSRLARIFPAYWLAHVPFLATWLVTGWGLSLFAWQTPASLLGLRVTPTSLYYFSPAWWYVGLALQLYLLFPFLWRVLRSRGLGALAVVGVAAPLLVRAVALLTTDTWLDLWARGGIALTRVPEFALGMGLAAVLSADAPRVDAWLRRRAVRLGAAGVYVAGLAASLTLIGNVVSPLLTLAGLFPWLYAAFARGADGGTDGGKDGGAAAPRRDALAWLGRNSYPLFLVHHPVLLKLMPVGFNPSAVHVFGRAALGFAVTLAVGLALGAVTARVERFGARLGARRVVRLLSLGVALAWTSLLGAEWAVRRFDPQEVDGWGERASLVPDAALGWRLAPGQVTHLRWQGYDYTVRANADGFPGPALPAEGAPRPAGALRVVTLGDAFTSAEGVDTEGAWPRLLEARLRAAGAGAGPGATTVCNLAVTGYGPTQYAELARTWLPRLRPDVVVMTFFVNDFGDARTPYERFREEIGFGRPPPDALSEVPRLPYLARFVELRIQDRWNAWRGAERVFGYGLGHFATLLRRPPGDADEAEEIAVVRARYAEVAAAARAVGARVVVPLIPAAPQVCARADLAYFPPAVDLTDDRYDVERPQRLIRPLIAEAGFEALDLSPVFRAAGACVYQPENMHWLPAGHALVAEAVARALGR